MAAEQRTVAIIGAGFGGLGMAAQLQKAGVEYKIFDRGGEVGGIWRDNIYPGCACDVPFALYSFSDDPPNSRSQYPSQSEVLGYLRRIAGKYLVTDHLKLRSEVTAAEFDEDANQWELTINGVAKHRADVVVCAVGQLHRPRIPDFPDQADYAGVTMHSARWDPSEVLDGRRIAVIGNGASAAQLMPYLAQRARQLYVFQRSASWVLPRPGALLSGLRRVPFSHAAHRAVVRQIGDDLLWPIMASRWSARPARWIADAYRRWHIADPRLREQLTPDYPLGCKRIVFDANYYRTLARDNVTLVTDPISRFTVEGIATSAGHHPVDVIIYATGFRAAEFLVPMKVIGRDGINLHEQWGGKPQRLPGDRRSELP